MRGTAVGNPRWRICTRNEEDGAPSAVRLGSEARMSRKFGLVGSFRKIVPRIGNKKLLARRTEREGVSKNSALRFADWPLTSYVPRYMSCTS